MQGNWPRKQDKEEEQSFYSVQGFRLGPSTQSIIWTVPPWGPEAGAAATDGAKEPAVLSHTHTHTYMPLHSFTRNNGVGIGVSVAHGFGACHGGKEGDPHSP